MKIEITQAPLFPYAFLLDNMKGKEVDKKFEIVQEWCNSNCNGRWMIIDSMGYGGIMSISISYYSKAVHDTPVEKHYPPSQIELETIKIISFEDETDAMAFKLSFTNDPRDNE